MPGRRKFITEQISRGLRQALRRQDETFLGKEEDETEGEGERERNPIKYSEGDDDVKSIHPQCAIFLLPELDQHKLYRRPLNQLLHRLGFV